MVTTMEKLRYAMLLFQQRAKLTQIWGEKFQLQHQQRQHSSDQKIEEVKRKAGIDFLSKFNFTKFNNNQ